MKRLIMTLAVMLMALRAGADDAAKDREKLQGDWTIMEFKMAGQDAPADKLGKSIATFKGDLFTIKDPAEPGTVTLNAASSPATIDLGVRRDGREKSLFKGIYKLEGDTLRICFGEDGQPRPGNFSSTRENKNILLVLSRAKK